MKSKKLNQILLGVKIFSKSIMILGGILVLLGLQSYLRSTIIDGLYLLLIVVGSGGLFIDTIKNLLKRSLALDYIAVLAVLVGIFTGEYLVAAIITLMYTTGTALETLATQLAKDSLTKLIDRIPDTVTTWDGKEPGPEVKIDSVEVDNLIVVSRGEVIPLDGVLEVKATTVDESSLTGEALPVDKEVGDRLQSGTVNLGDSLVMKVTKKQSESTYSQIVALVKEAQESKPTLVRLADMYSTWFTVITGVLAVVGYVLSFDTERIFAVLVIATPCPLLIATPIALIGGMSSFARKRIIVKKLEAIEQLAHVKALILDKTGTITLGKPKLTKVTLLSDRYDKRLALGVAAALERHSYHPLAKAIVMAATSSKAVRVKADKVEEVVGKGIRGVIDGKSYQVTKYAQAAGMAVALKEGARSVAVFHFEDQVKAGSKKTMLALLNEGIRLHLYTGDKRNAAEAVMQKLDLDMEIHAECKPKDKLEGIKQLKKAGLATAMVGDGINDAPALAAADVGMVFSHEEHTAASEAADVVFLAGNFGLVFDALIMSKKTIKVALQSIIVGIGLSVMGMVAAALGYLPPLYGAILQEVIDILVIINALRTSRLS